MERNPAGPRTARGCAAGAVGAERYPRSTVGNGKGGSYVSPEAITAIVAAGIALVALYFSWRTTQSARESARAAKEQSEIQRQLRIDAAQPYVWADIRPDEMTGTLINLVVGNSGPTIATNVRVLITPSLPTIEQTREKALAAQRILENGLSSLPPGRQYKWLLGQGFNLINGTAQEYSITIDFDGPFGSVPSLTYKIDLAELRHSLDRPIGSIHLLTNAVKDLTKALPENYILREIAPTPDLPPSG
jgi:hypothetical protein